MDDVLSGGDTLTTAVLRQEQLNNLLRAGGFHLRKWTANAPEFLDHLLKENTASSIHLARGEWNTATYNLLGITWSAATDEFLFQIHNSTPDKSITERTVLSQIARLYDPLGWLAPTIIFAKILLQSFWLLQLGWDDPLPTSVTQFWERYKNELADLTKLQIPRWLHIGAVSIPYEYHGFADASERAYAAVLYLRTVSLEDESCIRLIAAKTRVASIQQVSLPRFELCAAYLLVKLTKQVHTALALPNIRIYLWSDSTVTLSWIQSHSSRWKTYVANRVSAIQTLVPDVHWHYVASLDNPADCASRGIFPSELLNHKLWWQGPDFLVHTNSPWPSSNVALEDVHLEERLHNHVVATDSSEDWHLLNRFFTLSKLLCITAWCRRFILSCQRCLPKDSQKNILSPSELRRSLYTCVFITQRTAFARKIVTLTDGKELPTSSPLLRLCLFLDKTSLPRVGGRLKHSLLDHDTRHPWILPQKSHLSILVIRDCHSKTLHGGTQLTLNTVRRQFWILCGRRAVRGVIHRCVPCTRWRASMGHQLMSDLPPARVRPSRPFLHSRVDYAGPFLVRTWKGRGHKTYKAYLAVFICLSIRAVHLELVSDYTTDTFLAAYKRFTARRFTSFVPHSQVIVALTLLELMPNYAACTPLQVRRPAHSSSASQRRYILEFNPPAAPHFGGLWEAGVKSVKYHLRRVLGETKLTYEEMSTLLTQIEACLNSRPLQALNDDSGDTLSLHHF